MEKKKKVSQSCWLPFLESAEWQLHQSMQPSGWDYLVKQWGIFPCELSSELDLTHSPDEWRNDIFWGPKDLTMWPLSLLYIMLLLKVFHLVPTLLSLVELFSPFISLCLPSTFFHPIQHYPFRKSTPHFPCLLSQK